MHFITVWLITLVGALSINTTVHGLNFPTKIVGIGVDHIFVPLGFDSNDEVEIVVSGVLPSPCYEAPKVKFAIDGQKIGLTAYAKYKGEGRICPRVVVPYSKRVEIGQLAHGVYSVFFKNSRRSSEVERLLVKKAPKMSVDNFYYANVSETTIRPSKKTVKVDYYRMNDCMRFDRLHPVFNGRDVVSLLPIMAFEQKDKCKAIHSLESVIWKIPDGLVGKTFLIHTRSMAGQSLNKIYNGGIKYPSPQN